MELQPMAGGPAYRLGEHRLNEGERRLLRAMEACGAVYYEHTTDFDYGYFPPAWAAALGYASDELPPLPALFEWWQDRLHPLDREQVLTAYSEFVSGRSSRYDLEFRLRHRDGGWRWFRATDIAVERDADGRALFLAGVGFDITERRETEAEIADANARLRRSNEQLEQFAAVVSHDLKAPLRGVSCALGLLEEELAGQPVQVPRERFAGLHERLQRLGAFIDEILEYARGGGLSGPVEPVDTRKLVAEVVAAIEPPQGFRVLIEEPMPVLATCRTRLYQVFSNLIGNAVRCHDRAEGQVLVTARREGDLWEFTVADNGPGIDREQHQAIFKPFHRLVPSCSAGSGLGLALVKQWVESLGGQITVESAPGRGATFRFTWPTAEPVER